MLHKKLSALVLLLLCLCSIQLAGPEKFTELLDEARMSFSLPEGFHEVPVNENSQMKYEYAIQDASGDLEIRYTIRPIDSTAQTKIHMDFDNELTNFSVFNSILFNISDQKLKMPAIMKTIKRMPPNAVAHEFNGDDASFGMVNLGKEFGQQYKYSLVINLHKKATANAYIYLMAKDSSTLRHVTKPQFYALKFK